MLWLLGMMLSRFIAFAAQPCAIFLSFQTSFPNTQVIKLEENYRSTQPILDLSNEIILQAKESYTKNLFTHREEGVKPVLVEAESERYQSRFVGQKILELHESGVPLPEIAILFRSSFHSFDLEIELGKRNLQFVKRGGFKFIETTHIKDVLAHLRIIANPLDAVSWHRVLLLLDGVGPKSSEAILSHVLEGTDQFLRLVTYKGRGTMSAALKSLAETLMIANDEELKPAEKLEAIVRYYLPILKRRHHDDYPKRQKDLEHFTIITERYKSLDRMLSDMALEPPNSSVGRCSRNRRRRRGLTHPIDYSLR